MGLRLSMNFFHYLYYKKQLIVALSFYSLAPHLSTVPALQFSIIFKHLAEISVSVFFLDIIPVCIYLKLRIHF